MPSPEFDHTPEEVKDPALRAAFTNIIDTFRSAAPTEEEYAEKETEVDAFFNILSRFTVSRETFNKAWDHLVKRAREIHEESVEEVNRLEQFANRFVTSRRIVVQVGLFSTGYVAADRLTNGWLTNTILGFRIEAQTLPEPHNPLQLQKAMLSENEAEAVVTMRGDVTDASDYALRFMPTLDGDTLSGMPASEEGSALHDLIWSEVEGSYTAPGSTEPLGVNSFGQLTAALLNELGPGSVQVHLITHESDEGISVSPVLKLSQAFNGWGEGSIVSLDNTTGTYHYIAPHTEDGFEAAVLRVDESLQDELSQWNTSNFEISIPPLDANVMVERELNTGRMRALATDRVAIQFITAEASGNQGANLRFTTSTSGNPIDTYNPSVNTLVTTVDYTESLFQDGQYDLPSGVELISVDGVIRTSEAVNGHVWYLVWLDEEHTEVAWAAENFVIDPDNIEISVREDAPVTPEPILINAPIEVSGRLEELLALEENLGGNNVSQVARPDQEIPQTRTLMEQQLTHEELMSIPRLTFADGMPVPWTMRGYFEVNGMIYAMIPGIVRGVHTNGNEQHAVISFPSEGGTNNLLFNGTNSVVKIFPNDNARRDRWLNTSPDNPITYQQVSNDPALFESLGDEDAEDRRAIMTQLSENPQMTIFFLQVDHPYDFDPIWEQAAEQILNFEQVSSGNQRIDTVLSPSRVIINDQEIV